MKQVFWWFAITILFVGCAHSPAPKDLEPPFPTDGKPLRIDISSGLARAMAFSAHPNRSSQALLPDGKWIEDAVISPGTHLRLDTVAGIRTGIYLGRDSGGAIVIASIESDPANWHQIPLEDTRVVRVVQDVQLALPIGIGLLLGAGLVAVSSLHSASGVRTMIGAGTGGAIGLGFGMLYGIDPTYEVQPADLGRRIRP